MNSTTETINARLRHFIASRGMDCRQFAYRMGWSENYLSKLITGDSMGLKPVKSLLAEFPDLDARWLILGEDR